MARARRRTAEAREDAGPGQPRAGRPDPAARQRRLGARVLPDLPEQATRLPEGVVERRELGQGRRAVRRREGLSGRVAVVGAGPAGFYACEDLLKAGFEVDLYDVLPTPFGL